MPPTPRPSSAQAVALVDFLEQHPQLARGRMFGQDVDARPGSRHKAQYLWRVVSLQLNAMNGCKKNIAAWKKYWNDKKSNTKKNAAKSMETSVGMFKAELSDLEVRILKLLGEDIGDGITPFRSKPGDTDTVTTPLVGWLEVDDGSEDEKPTVDSLPDSDSEMILPCNNSTKTPFDTVLLHPDPPHMEQPRLHSELSDATARLVAIEERRIEGQARLAQGVHSICSNLVATKNEESEVARAQMAAAREQQQAAREQARAARRQAEVARAQTEAAQALTEAAKALLEAIREARSQDRAVGGKHVLANDTAAQH